MLKYAFLYTLVYAVHLHNKRYFSKNWKNFHTAECRRLQTTNVLWIIIWIIESPYHASSIEQVTLPSDDSSYSLCFCWRSSQWRNASILPHVHSIDSQTQGFIFRYIMCRITGSMVGDVWEFSRVSDDLLNCKQLRFSEITNILWD